MTRYVSESLTSDEFLNGLQETEKCMKRSGLIKIVH